MPLAVVDVFVPGGEQFVVHGATTVSQASRGESDGKVGTRWPVGISDTQGFEN